MKFRRSAALGLATILAATSLTACGRGASNDEDTIKLGTTEADMGYWKVFEDEAEGRRQDQDHAVRRLQHPQPRAVRR